MAKIYASTVLKVAKKEIGVKEKPANSNCVKYNTTYYGKKVKGWKYPWCCVFVWWVFKKAGASKLFFDGKKIASAPDFGDWAIAKKLKVSKKNGRPGDLVLFDFNHNGTSDHIGIIEKVNSDGTYSTIEGNTSLKSNDNGGKVMRRKRSQSQINYLVRPKYSKATSTAKKTVDTSKYPTLKKGSKGAYVKKLKTKLKAKGYKGMDSTNIFGDGTLKAVKKFQKSKKLKVDGIVGKNTWKALYK